MSSPTPEYLKTHEIVRAGAGAGKTYALTHKVMDIAEHTLETEQRLPRVIVTTFTRKATQELRERLMLLALDEKPGLIDFVNSRSHLVVSTIHGVMDLYLKRYGGNINLDPSYSVIGPAEAAKIARTILRRILFNDPDKDAQELLEVFQFNRLVLLIRRIDRLLLENPVARPYQEADFQALFTSRAAKLANELTKVAEKIKSESVKADWLAMAADFEKLAFLLHEPDWPKNRDSFLLLADTMKTARKNAKAPPVTDATADEAKDVRTRAKELAEPVFDPTIWTELIRHYAVFDRLGRDFSEQFNAEKTRQGVLEISDLEIHAMRCIREHPATAEAFQAEWDHWLIDEYQDTSPFQVELLRQLSGEKPNYIVGDPQQSIYLFRGARSEVFAKKEADISTGGGTQRLLKMNRRSEPSLLLFLNDFFSRFDPPFQSMEAKSTELKSEDKTRMAGAIPDATIFIAPEPEKKVNPALVSDEPSAEAPVSGAETETSTSTSTSTANEGEGEKNALELRALIVHVQALLLRGARYEDICILGRTNRTLSDVANELGRYRLPTHVHASSGFFDRREIRDALAFLKFLTNPHDNFTLIELIRSPWFRVPDASIAEMTATRPESVWEHFLSTRSQADEFRAVGRLARYLEMTMKDGLAETFRRGLIETGFFDLSDVHDVSGRRESNLWKLLAKLQQEEAQTGFNPVAFIAASLNDLKVDQANAEGDAVAAVEPDRINLMTVHSSKGLEFKHVLVPQMAQPPRLTTHEEFTYDEENGLWALRVPYGVDHEMMKSLPEVEWLERFRAHELKEHARVLYVALTRAIESVYMSWTLPAKKNSWADMVKLDLNPGLHQTEQFTYLVRTEPGEPSLPSLSEKKTSLLRSPWRLTTAAADAGVSALPSSVSVTELLDRKVGIQFVLGENPAIAKRLKVTSEGTAVHKLMELLKYPSQSRLKQIVQKWFPGREEKVLAAVDFVRECSNPPLLEIIQNGFVEWSFAMVDQGVLIEGQVDLWGRSHDGQAWLIDYKTGSSQFRKKAFDQMALYAVALFKSGQVKPDENLNLAAVYPFTKEIFLQPYEPDRKTGSAQPAPANAPSDLEAGFSASPQIQWREFPEDP